MLFKDISYLELWRLFCSADPIHLCNFGRGCVEEQFFKLILNEWFKRRSLLKIFYLELWRPFCSAERNHLCNFGRKHHDEQFCEIILNLDQWFKRRCCLKIFLICSSGGPLIQRSGTIFPNVVEVIMRNNSVNLFFIWADGSGRDVV